MESRAFIRAAADLITRISVSQQTIAQPEELRVTRDSIQRDIGNLMTSNLNPTLPSAFRLRDAALRAGYSISPPVLQRLGSFENWSA